MPPTRTTARFDVRSPDGTHLAVWVDGHGPPLVMVHGALSDHTRFAMLIPELRRHLTTFSMDRRGRGASGDGPEYSIEREFEDVAAVIDEVAARTGRPVGVWGHSYGADCALGGAALTESADHLILYEPGLGFRYPAGSIEGIEAAIAAGDREGAVLALLRDAVGATDDEIAAIRSSPVWPSRLATAATLGRELRAENDWVYRPGRFAGLTSATVLLAGTESPPEQQRATRAAAAAVPAARVLDLEGHGHFAFQADPGLIAAIIRDFLAS